MARNFRSIQAWKFSDDLAVTVYEATKMFPSEERYGLISQMRRAAVSVPANIAEGATRSSQREYAQFLSIAKGSLAELEYYLHLSKRLRYMNDSEHDRLFQLQQLVGRVLHGLLKSVVQKTHLGDTVGVS